MSILHVAKKLYMVVNNKHLKSHATLTSMKILNNSISCRSFNVHFVVVIFYMTVW